MHLVRRDPHTCGCDRSRWRLADLLDQSPWLRLHWPQSLGRLLARLDLAYKRGRAYLHSPDPDYVAKLAAVAAARQIAADDPTHHAVLYMDEMTLYRQPTLAPAWAAVGPEQPLARRSERADTATRIVGAVDAVTGQVHSALTKPTVPNLVRFCQDLVAAYPEGTQLTVVLDNWPVHFHPDLLVALVPQTSPFPCIRPANWSPVPHPKAVARWGTLALPIQFLPLPTYAPWTNPIEKVWRKLRQDLGHLHPWADDLPCLRAALRQWLAGYHAPSPDLLRYVGLATHD